MIVCDVCGSQYNVKAVRVCLGSAPIEEEQCRDVPVAMADLCTMCKDRLLTVVLEAVKPRPTLVGSAR